MPKRQRTTRKARAPRVEVHVVEDVLCPLDGWSFPTMEDLQRALTEAMIEAIEYESAFIPWDVDEIILMFAGMDYGWISMERNKGEKYPLSSTYHIHDPAGSYAPPPEPPRPSRTRKKTTSVQPALA